jgi:hypothetical protein
MIAKFVFNPENKEGFHFYKNEKIHYNILNGAQIVFSQVVEKDTYIALDKKGNIVVRGELETIKKKIK